MRGLSLMRRKLISSPQVGGQSFGKYWFSWDTRPPRYGFFSTRNTS